MLLPGVSAPALTPELSSSALMFSSGVAWGIYSLRGQGVVHPIQVTARNFMLATLFALMLSLLLSSGVQLEKEGVLYAVFSGAIASGLGYSIWYLVLPYLKASNAAIVQLSVPVIAALGGLLILGEPVTLRFFLATIFILGGIALVILSDSELPSGK